LFSTPEDNSAESARKSSCDKHLPSELLSVELVILDILTRPSPEFSTEGAPELKKLARDLLARLKQLLVLSWRQKTAARHAPTRPSSTTRGARRSPRAHVA
jgi:hypothetical protein